MWRPEGWKNPYNGYRSYTGEGAVNQANENLRAQSELAFEAGADAMLEALMIQYGEKIKKGEWTDDSTFEADSNGVVVSFLIPD